MSETIRLPWTDDRIERLKQRWNDGMSSSQIAADLGGGATRNSVIGKLNRLKLLARQKRAKPGPKGPRTGPKGPRSPAALERQRAARVARAVGWNPSNLRKATAAAKKAEKPMPPPPFTPDHEIMAMSASEPLPGTTPITDILLLNDSVCRWPLGDPLLPGFAYCGCETATGSPYCPTHKARATGQGTQGEQLAVKAARRIGRMEAMVQQEAA